MDPERWRVVSRIAADAMELETAARAAYLDHACGGDGDLRAEVERILGAHEGFDPLLDPGTADDAAAPESREAPDASAALMRVARPASAGSDGPRLPTELIERGARRLRTLAILYAAGFVAAYVAREVAVHAFGHAAYDQAIHTPGQVLAVLFALLGVAVAALAGRRSVAAPRLVNAGLAFEVVGSLGIALASYSSLWQAEGSVWGVSWLCVWIMMFPLVIPAPPRAAALAAFGSAAMAPLAILLWAVTRGLTFPPAWAVLAATAPNVVVAALAVVGARHLYRIGVELREAKRFGHYRLVERLGRGGMGEVWVAEHALLARPAALKLIRPDLLTAGGDHARVLARFEREAQSTAALTSAHTVRLYDFGSTEDGQFYYVMERLEGLDLDALVRRTGPVPPARAIHFLRQACASLGEAHALGLVHRDIKPSNLFACRQGLEHDVIKVLDFGIVRPSTHQATADAAPHPVEGTPAFMAPEASRGEATPATDLYALGCVGYWLVTGHPVFEDDAPSRSHGALIPPSIRSGRDVPPALESAILACLEPDPSRRPQGADRLDALLADVPVPAWDQARARAWWEARGPSGTRFTPRMVG